jgi:hypothetical protein
MSMAIIIMWIAIIALASLATFAVCYIIYRASDEDLWY